MKTVKHIVTGVALVMTYTFNVFADEPPVRPDLTGENYEETQETPQPVIPAIPANGAVGEDGSAHWYIDMNYGGFSFQVPAGSVVEMGDKFLARYPDGSFGVSMTNQERTGLTQDLAFQICKQMATTLHLPDPKVKKVKFGKSAGAQASGELEGQQVTIVVLPNGHKEVTTVILATPNRSEWTDHFLKSLTL